MRAWLLLALLLLATPALAEPIIGRPSVIDGDTLDVRGTRIRLHGVDAPEAAQTCRDASGKDYRCGQSAALALADHIGSRASQFPVLLFDEAQNLVHGLRRMVQGHD